MGIINITNATAAGLGLPNGPIVPARGTTPVESEAWAEMRRNRVVGAWLEAGWLTEGGGLGGKPAPAPVAAIEDMSDDELRAVLKDKGVTTDGRWGRERLVSEAKKAAT